MSLGQPWADDTCIDHDHLRRDDLNLGWDTPLWSVRVYPPAFTLTSGQIASPWAVNTSCLTASFLTPLGLVSLLLRRAQVWRAGSPNNDGAT